MRIPYVQPPARPISEKTVSSPSRRLGPRIRSYDGSRVDVGILGVPTDAGVIQGGGRRGAGLGPAAIREQLCRYGTVYNFERAVDLSTVAIADFGDLIPDDGSVEQTHQRLSDAVEAITRLGAIPLLLGGGHDLTFGGVRGLACQAKGEIGGITLDAHFDVREVIDGVITSGTPFRNILEKIDLICGERFVEIGGNGLVNSKAHFDYLTAKKARIFSLSESRRRGMGTVVEKSLQIAGHGAGEIFCSIDLDSIGQAFAPGVSAPSPEGFMPEEVTLAAYLFGLHPKTAYFDVMEMNPNFDQDGRTARLATALVLHFLAGVAQRGKQRERMIGFQGGEK
ncbi:MAG: agmatinase family protein [Nitrospiria bacterium]